MRISCLRIGTLPIFLLLAFLAIDLGLRAQPGFDHRRLASYERAANFQPGTWQWGGALRGTVIFTSNSFFNSFRLNVVGGVSKWIRVQTDPVGEFTVDAMPTYHLDVELYRGGMGASSASDIRDNLILEIHHSLASNIQLGGNEYDWVKPLFHNDYSHATPLLNPYHNSLGLGVIFSWTSHGHSQRRGMLVGSFGRTTFSYINDGAPPLNMWFWNLGDGYDRYHTGGGFITVEHPEWNKRYAYAFQKYTGHGQDEFELGIHLGLDYTPYKDEAELLYNKSLVEFSVIDLSSGFEFAYGFLDRPFIDIQNYIHVGLDQSLHPAVLGRRSMFRVSYQYSNALLR
ncbi:MAG: hypothetical protein RLP15_12325 [Cryomorphaceae bacterium]